MQKKGGRPRKFKNKRQLEDAIEAYFARCDESCIPPTMPGLAMALGFTKVSSLNYMEKQSTARSQFSAVLGRARLVIEDYWESLLVGRDSTPGQVQLAMMVLKRSFGWSGKNERKQVGGEKRGEVKVQAVGWDGWQAMWREEEVRRVERRCESGRAG
ncbi:terminase small subunit [Desulfonatronum parangueonense]